MEPSRSRLIDMSDYSPALRVYWWSAVVAGAIAFAWSVLGLWRLNESALPAVVGLMVLAALAGLTSSRVPGTQVIISPGDIFVFLAALLHGPAAATVVAVTEAVGVSFRKSQRWTSRIGGPAFQAVAIWVSASLFSWTLERLRETGRLSNSALILALLAFSALYFLLNTMLVAGHYAFKQGERLLSHWRRTYPWIGLGYLAGAATAGFVYSALLNRDPAALIGAAPLVAVIYAMSRFYYKQAEEKIKAAERVRLIVDNTSEAVFAFDMGGRISFVNPAIEQLTEYTVDEAMSLTFLSLIHADESDRFDLVWQKLMRGERCSEEEFRIQTKSGKSKWCSGSWGPLSDVGGRQIGVQGHLRDISEHKALQSQFFHSQKMEAIGRLAGGIAHDFNNLLTAMTGYAQMTLAGLAPNEPIREHVKQFVKATERAASLTRQLLAFARRQPLQPAVLDLNLLVKEVDELLRRLLGSDIELIHILSPSPLPIKADSGQIEQVIVNLAVNARDAMPGGGTLTIRTGSLEVDDATVKQAGELASGNYAVLSVSDTGCGMEPETASRVFEPFFTTKERGKGTGFGLSTVYGIVKQSGGHVVVESESGQGATFRVYLPRAVSELPRQSADTVRGSLSSGSETILVVDDDEGPRKVVAEILRSAGYNVIQASTPAEALALCDEHDGPIHLMISDVLMPQLNGLELAQRAAPLRPGMKLLFMSGQPDAAALPGISLAEAPFLQKPFSIETLSRKVREILDHGAASGSVPEGIDRSESQLRPTVS